MLHRGNRTIKVNKKNLIETINKNKEAHIKEYELAVKAFKLKAKKQLDDLLTKVEGVNEGELDTIKLDLVYPVNNATNYDKVAKMFGWDEGDLVELTQDEYLQYIEDENSFTESAKFANMAYVSDFNL